MTKHLEAAAYHRSQATKEVAQQGRSGGEWYSSRSNQMTHERAAQSADRAHATSTGQSVRYTPLGVPVFSKGR